jgi:hypothetical protein
MIPIIGKIVALDHSPGRLPEHAQNKSTDPNERIDCLVRAALFHARETTR